MLHKSRLLILAVAVLLLFSACSGVELKQDITETTLNDKSLTLSVPDGWVHSSDGDLMFFGQNTETLEDDWYMMLSANLISTVSQAKTVEDIAQKIILDDFDDSEVTRDKLSDSCYWVGTEAGELSYFIVSDEDTGIYIYGRTYNSAVDAKTSKAIAKSIKLS